MLNTVELSRKTWTWRSAKKTYCPSCGKNAWKHDSRYIAQLNRIIERYRCPHCRHHFDERDI